MRRESGGQVAGSTQPRLVWAGKDDAAASASAPPAGRLVLDEAASRDVATTGNLLVVGDNLEALKLLRGQLEGRVDCLYLDPPYNTGNAFVFADSFPEPAAWASMMLPRLILARRLLGPHGVGFISIDDNELATLRLLVEEVFGRENVLATFCWVNNLKGRQLHHAGPAGTHEYIVCFARDAAAAGRFRGRAEELRRLMPSVYPGTAREVRHDAVGPYVVKNQLHNTNGRFNEQTTPTLVYRIHYRPDTGEVRVSDLDDPITPEGFLTAMPHPNARPGLRWHAWRWSRARVLAHADDLEFDCSGGVLTIWTKVRDITSTALKDVVIGPSTQSGQADLARLGLARVFDQPKPVALVRLLLDAAAGPDALVLDFFAGSGTTGQAVMDLNASDAGTRRFVLVQRDEPVPPGSAAAQAGFTTIPDITRERLRRAGDRIVAASDGRVVPDTGLRVLRVEPDGGAAPAR